MREVELAMLRSGLRRLLEETDGAKVDPALRDFGWHELQADEPAAAVALLFELQGEGVRATTMLETVMTQPLTALYRGDDGERHTLVVPQAGHGGIPHSSVADDGTVRVDAYGLMGFAEATSVFVPAHHGGALVVAVVDRSALGPCNPVAGMDPQLGVVRVAATAPATSVLHGVAADAAWVAALAAGRRALAHELIGLTRAALDLAVGHAGSRHQFGRPIGGYQAVKHRLADVKVTLVAAEEAAAEAGATGAPFAALLAKDWAGRAARSAGRHVQQVLGGMGFTWEHDFHRYLRRILVDDALLGSSSELTAALGWMIVDRRHTPQGASL